MDDFRELVKAMRDAQKRYFRERTKGALADAMDFEALVDDAIANGADPVGWRQKDLFEAARPEERR